jgi:alanyl-tRNA synthetase
MNSQTISERFVQYYQNLGFDHLPSTSLLHPSIPMTFVMSAGLAQVETAIDQLGSRSPQHDYVLVQNCFRHFDVDRIGRSSLHLSLFEMPGAFSFGHNDRKTTVQRMWHLVTRLLKIDPDRLWATFFAGDRISGHYFDEDLGTRQAWQEVGLPASRLIGLGAEHNFWKQGGGIDGQETSRKCGPNTELFFDRGSHLRCNPNCQPGCQCGRFVEFANSLFIFAEIDADTNACSLMAEPFTETVIGGERVAMILAGQSSVFEIETIRPLIEALRAFYPALSENKFRVVEHSERVLVDHLRALAYLTADGAPPPGKGGRRRLMRILIRRVLAQLQLLQIDSPRCVPALIDRLITLDNHRHPNLNFGRHRLLTYLKAEVPTFDQTLARGYRQLDRLLASNNGSFLDGRQLVNLVKQFGVPVPLLKVALAQRGYEFRESEYSSAMEQWRHNQLSPRAARQ